MRTEHNGVHRRRLMDSIVYRTEYAQRILPLLCNVQDDTPATVAALTELMGLVSFIEREDGTNKGLYLAFLDEAGERAQKFACDLG
jgi:hypothetical protein